MKHFFGSMISSHAKRHGAFSDKIVRAAELYVTNFYQNGEMHENGEFHLITNLKKIQPSCIFDIGANIGDWTFFALNQLEKAKIHAFEPAPETFHKLNARFRGEKRVKATEIALSSECGHSIIDYFPDAPGSTSLISDMKIHDLVPQKIKINTMTGDKYCASNNIEYIDFIKCDVEGAERDVFIGLIGLFSNKKIGAIQFEYGYANIFSRFLLKDAYEFLVSHEFEVGRLGPSGVQFIDYKPTMENFKGPNFVAVHRSREDIKRCVVASW